MKWPKLEQNIPIPPKQNVTHKRKDKLKWVENTMQENDSFLCETLEDTQSWVMCINSCNGFKGVRRQMGTQALWRVWKIKK